MATPRTCVVSLALSLVVALSASAVRELHTDQFDRVPLSPTWTFFAPGGGSYEVRDGWLHITSPGFLDVMAGDEPSMAPMLLIEPPVSDVFTFETRLRFVAIRKDLESRMSLEVYTRPLVGMVVLTWLAGPLHGGDSAQVGLAGDTWLRAELPADMPFTEPRFFYRQGGAEVLWIDATAPDVVFPFRLPADIIKPRFLAGEYLIGLFVRGGWDERAEDNEAEVAFDYFHSPEMLALTAHTGSTAATIWGSVKHR